MPAIYHEGSWLGNATDPEVLVKDTVGWTGKNLLPYPYQDIAKLFNGVTYVYNSDNSITANGTATSTSWRTLVEDFSFLEPNERYILSGCPSGGSDSSYSIRLTYNDGTEKSYKDYGDGIEFINTNNLVRMQVIVANGYTANNLVFKPMLRKADITDPTYEPYHESVEEEIEQIYADNGVLGAKNLLRSKNTAKTVTIAGITFTVDDDGSITVNGTATADVSYEFVRGTNDVLEKGKSYIASTGQTANGGLQVYYKVNDSNSWVQLANVVTEEKEFFLPSNANFILIRIFFSNGNTVSNKVYYPMIRLASDPDDTYQPYAMTNRELTEKKINIADLKTVVSASSDFADFKTRIASL